MSYFISTDRRLNPLVATAGFYHEEILLDHIGIAQQLKTRLSIFPEALKRESLRILHARRQGYLSDLKTFAARADWFMFHRILLDALRITLQALFSVNEVYYPGDKWLRQSIIRFGLDAQILTWFDRLWEASGNASEKMVALRQLMDLVEGHETGERHPVGESGDGLNIP